MKVDTHGHFFSREYLERAPAYSTARPERDPFWRDHMQNLLLPDPTMWSLEGRIEKMDEEGFGACTNHAECQDACPKGISIQFISEMNRQYRDTSLRKPKKVRGQLESQ